MNFSPTAKRMILVVGISSLVIILGGAVYFILLPSPDTHFWGSLYPFAIGVCLMGTLNCAKVLMLEHAVNRALDMDSHRSASAFIRFQYLIRFVATGLVLWISHASPFVNLWGAIAGVFTFQIAAHSLKSLNQ